MGKITKIISVISGKGGVGKTTLVSNLGVALNDLGKSVLVIDANVTGANLGLHLGVPHTHPISLNDVLKNEAYFTQAIYKHSSGVSIIPATLHDLECSASNLKHLLSEVIGQKDFVLIDAAAGTNEEVKAAIEASDSVMIITNPDMPSITNALSAKKLAEKHDKEIIGVVLNNARNEKHELRSKEVEALLELPILVKIPDHKKVREAISLGKPVVSYAPRNPSSKAIRDLSFKLAEQEPAMSLLDRLLSAIGVR